MIQQATIGGRPASVAYLNDKFELSNEASATLVKVTFTDERGGCVFMIPDPNSSRGYLYPARSRAGENSIQRHDFDPSQPRDEDGKWTGDGGSSSSGSSSDGGSGSNAPAADKEAIRADLSANKGNSEQPVKTLDELYERAMAGEAAFIDDVEELAKTTGGKTMWTPSSSSHPGTRLKNKTTAAAKIKRELDGNPALLRDVMRATVVHETVENSRLAALKFIKENPDTVVRVKDRFVKDLSGYRDILINYRTSKGIVAEVQFNTKDMIDAKLGEGHRVYEEMRQLNPAKDRERLADLETKSFAIYNGAYQRSGNGNWGKSK